MLKSTFLALATLAFAGCPAFAAGLSAVQTVERVVKTVAEDGTETVTVVPAEEVTPGQVLVYGLAFTNDGDEAVENVVLTVPVPAEVSYVENSAAAEGATVEFSADDGVSFAPRDALKVSSDGQERDAISSDITHVRWTLTEPVAAGADGNLSFHAVLK